MVCLDTGAWVAGTVFIVINREVVVKGDMARPPTLTPTPCAHPPISATSASQNIKVKAEAKVETEMAATEKSASPPISLAMT